MKVPDKIYVREYPDGLARFWESKRKEDVVATIPHEYIHKDALLEWLENKIKTPDVSFINGLTYLAYKDVIEHINSM